MKYAHHMSQNGNPIWMPTHNHREADRASWGGTHNKGWSVHPERPSFLAHLSFLLSPAFTRYQVCLSITEEVCPIDMWTKSQFSKGKRKALLFPLRQLWSTLIGSSLLPINNCTISWYTEASDRKKILFNTLGQTEKDVSTKSSNKEFGRNLSKCTFNP